MDDQLNEFVGRKIEISDLIAAYPIDALNATFGVDAPAAKAGDVLAPGWHKFFFLATPKPDELSPDGLAISSDILPEMPELPRRMFAGEELTFHNPVRVGENVRCEMVLDDITIKQGRSGKLAFVTLVNRFWGDAGLALEERYHRVYREQVADGESNQAPAGAPAPDGIEWRRTIAPNIVMLFRFSAITFNAHRIHYDRAYAREEEGYPGLVVHGPLLSSLLIGFAVEHAGGRALATYAMRARAPVFDTGPFEIAAKRNSDGSGLELWALNPDNTIAMSATATFA